MTSSDTRHPYTYACDFVRALGPCGTGGVTLSRSNASQIIEGIAKVLGKTHEELAIELSLAQQAKSNEEHTKGAEKVLKAIFPAYQTSSTNDPAR